MKIKYILVAYVNDLCFVDKEGNSVKYAKIIFAKDTKNGRSLEVFKAVKDMDVYGYVDNECIPYFDEKGRVISLG